MTQKRLGWLCQWLLVAALAVVCSTASVTAQTAPGAACSIVVLYKSGPGGAQGLGLRPA